MSILASITGLSVYYGNGPAALDAISFDIIAGERLAIIGESGSGKSTLGAALSGLLPRSARIAGNIAWPGLEHTPRLGADIGFVFQDPGNSLNPVLSLGEQVGEAAHEHLGLSWKQSRAYALDLLQRVQLPHAEQSLRAFPHQFSGGQRQRISIASAIAGQPRLLIADEPTSALDMLVQAEIVKLLDDLVRAKGMTLVFITHDIALASGFADRIAVFRQGRLVEIGATADIIARPKSDYTKLLLAAHIDLDTPPLIAGGAP